MRELVPFPTENSKMMNNLVAVRFDLAMEDMQTPSGLYVSGFDVEGETDQANHATRTGIVTHLPKRLRLAKKPNDGGIEWGTTNELNIGDLVVFPGLSYYNQVGLKENDETVGLLLPYEQIICYKRDDNLVPINGNCLVTIVKEQETHSFLYMGREKWNRDKGVVITPGKKNSSYLGTPHVMDADIKTGDNIIVSQASINRLESFNGDKYKCRFEPNLGYIQKRWIMAIEE